MRPLSIEILKGHPRQFHLWYRLVSDSRSAEADGVVYFGVEFSGIYSAVDLEFGFSETLWLIKDVSLLSTVPWACAAVVGRLFDLHCTRSEIAKLSVIMASSTHHGTCPLALSNL